MSRSSFGYVSKKLRTLKTPDYFVAHSDSLMMFIPLTIANILIQFHLYITKNRNLKKQQTLLLLPNFLDLYMYIEFVKSGYITRIYDKQDDFNFETIFFPNLSSIIPASNYFDIQELARAIRLYKTSEQKADEPGLCSRTSSPSIKRSSEDPKTF